MNYQFTYPNTRSKWHVGIQTTNGKLVGFILGFPRRIHIDKEIKFIQMIVHCHKKYIYKRMRYILIKELTRRANLAKINQLMVFGIGHGSFFKPVTTIIHWAYQFNQLSGSQLPSSPRTPGWRRMTSEDVPSALALINKWSSQFEIRQVYNSEEVLHKFVFQRFVFTYVVEDITNNITDLVSYALVNVADTGVHINAVVSTQSPVKQLITDALVCARENGASAAVISQHNLKSDILTSLSFQPCGDHRFHFYNYRYHEISQAKCGLFEF